MDVFLPSVSVFRCFIHTAMLFLWDITLTIKIIEQNLKNSFSYCAKTDLFQGPTSAYISENKSGKLGVMNQD